MVSGKYEYSRGAHLVGGACLTMVITGRNYASFCRDGGDLVGDTANVLGVDRTIVEALNAGWEHWKKKDILRRHFDDSKWDKTVMSLGWKLADEYAVLP